MPSAIPTRAPGPNPDAEAAAEALLQRCDRGPGRDRRHQILLDGRSVRTPARQPLTVPTASLAELVAEEWRAQPR